MFILYIYNICFKQTVSLNEHTYSVYIVTILTIQSTFY